MGKSIPSIIIVTFKGSPFISECLDRLEGCKYPIHLCINPDEHCPYDPGAFYYARDHKIETFIVLHDSMFMKDMTLFDKAFGLKGNISIGDNFLMCFGKYELKTLLPLPPKPISKADAVAFETLYLRSIKPDHTLCPEFNDTQNFIEKYGQKRMVLENEYLIKYKATWDTYMIKEKE